MANKGLVICKLPKAGLGNQLFPLMRAAVFAHLNDLPLQVINYHQLKPGPWLRNEKSKRNYKGFFTFQKSILREAADKMKIGSLLKIGFIDEPSVEKLESCGEQDVFLFTKMPHYTNYFEGLEDYRALVIELLYKLVSPQIKKQLNETTPPVIGLHIRLGDFMKSAGEQELGTRGNLRTPLQYFIRIIESTRALNGTTLPVIIFSDGSKQELAELLTLPNVLVSEGNNDLMEMLLLSRSKVIVTSASSTFSYWAAFLSEAVVLMHPTYVGIKIRPEESRYKVYEGEFDETSGLMIAAIKSINNKNLENNKSS